MKIRSKQGLMFTRELLQIDWIKLKKHVSYQLLFYLLLKGKQKQTKWPFFNCVNSIISARCSIYAEAFGLFIF